MIKIHDKLWYVIQPDHEDNLAYMCQYQTDKEGNPSSNVVKMQATGRSWARIYTGATYNERIPKDGKEFIVDNKPTEGFYVGCSVSRWSTSNKLFRVKDPRGFTVEIPTDNLATLLHHTTVVNGVVQEACVWGREGNNHILLPVNSEPYLITLDQMDTLENKLINLKDLKVGDWIKLFEDKREIYYAGKVKITWKVRGCTPAWRYDYWNRDRKDTYSDWVEVEDDKWIDLLLYKYDYTKEDSKYYTLTASKPKIVEIIKNSPLTLDKEQLSIYIPARVVSKAGLKGWYTTNQEIISIKYKEEKK